MKPVPIWQAGRLAWVLNIGELELNTNYWILFFSQMAAPSNQPMNGFPFPLTSPHRKSSKHGIQHIFTHKKIHNTNCKLYLFDIITGRQGRNLQLNCNKTQTITFAQHQYTRNTNFIAILHPAASLLIRAFVGDIKVINRADLALPS